jgi:hypothetical protein
VRRVPRLVVDAVQDADQPSHIVAQEAVQTLAELGRLDLGRVARADRGHQVGGGHPALDEAGAVVELEHVLREHRPVQAELGHDLLVEHALVEEVVHGHERARRMTQAAQVDRDQPGLPVVGVEEVGRGAERERRRRDRGAAQEGEAERVVGVVAQRAAVDAVAIVERRAVEEEVRDALVGGRGQPDQARGQIGRRQRDDDVEPGVLELVTTRERALADHPVERRHNRDLDGRIGGCEGARQAAHHLAQPAGLRPGRDLGRDVHDPDQRRLDQSSVRPGGWPSSLPPGP